MAQSLAGQRSSWWTCDSYVGVAYCGTANWNKWHDWIWPIKTACRYSWYDDIHYDSESTTTTAAP